MAMTRHEFISNLQVVAFRRIMTRLEKTEKSDVKTLNLIGEAREILKMHDIGWDTVTLRVPGDYVRMSERNRKKLMPVVRAATALNGKTTLGVGGRTLLKQAIARHAEWPTVKEALGVDLHLLNIKDLIAIAQLLKIDEQFLKLFADIPDTDVDQSEGTTGDLFDHSAE